MQGRSPSDVIKPEVRAASAYTLKHVAADVKLDQNENPFELSQEFKEEVARRVVARPLQEQCACRGSPVALARFHAGGFGVWGGRFTVR